MTTTRRVLVYWSVMELAKRHISTPTIAAAQFLRVASGNRPQRLKVAKKLSLAKPPKFRLEDEDEGNYLRYKTGEKLPIRFMEAENFEAHGSDRPGYSDSSV
ncbi:uncharacterized protein RCO7_01307 [Rhynchosporium graminicola]|uniref:Uncharacterized protein n=1 Tax=Rhynchosporium graminicola TaxID=2792576 RepID=A0A1E1K584_9HELO|nr:uncharacterized protein RCO7_01307 [Rhynchosporium commune]